MPLEFSFPGVCSSILPTSDYFAKKSKGRERKEQLPKSESSVRFRKRQRPQRSAQITSRRCGSAPELMASQQPWRRKASGRPLDPLRASSREVSVEDRCAGPCTRARVHGGICSVAPRPPSCPHSGLTLCCPRKGQDAAEGKDSGRAREGQEGKQSRSRCTWLWKGCTPAKGHPASKWGCSPRASEQTQESPLCILRVSSALSGPSVRGTRMTPGSSRPCCAVLSS